MNRRLWLGFGMLILSSWAWSDEPNPLLGCWQCNSDGESMPLYFSVKSYVIDGSPLPYQLVEGAIQVREPDGVVRYPYTLMNGQLTINFDNMPPLVCLRTRCKAGKSTGM